MCPGQATVRFDGTSDSWVRGLDKSVQWLYSVTGEKYPWQLKKAAPEKP